MLVCFAEAGLAPQIKLFPLPTIDMVYLLHIPEIGPLTKGIIEHPIHQPLGPQKTIDEKEISCRECHTADCTRNDLLPSMVEEMDSNQQETY